MVGAMSLSSALELHGPSSLFNTADLAVSCIYKNFFSLSFRLPDHFGEMREPDLIVRIDGAGHLSLRLLNTSDSAPTLAVPNCAGGWQTLEAVHRVDRAGNHRLVLNLWSFL